MYNLICKIMFPVYQCANSERTKLIRNLPFKTLSKCMIPS